MTDAQTLSDWARLFVGSLARAGIDTIVVSPGSRSTPLVWAALEEPRLTLESIVDERDAAFWAVGRAKITGRPTAVLCTSGSAAANYFPAVVEASMSGTPLVLVTADRPYELMQAGASQTIDQVKLFGGFVRSFVDVGMPDASPGALRGLRRAVSQAAHTSRGDAPGPVHLNFRARKPLEPEPRGIAGVRRLVDELLAEPLPRGSRARRLPAPDSVERLLRAASAAERPLVVCGPMPPAARVTPAAIAALADRLGAPVFAETSSGIRHGAPDRGVIVADAFGTLAVSPRQREALRPDFVVQIGTTPISGGYAALLAEAPHPTRFVLSSMDWMDPQSSATEVLFGDLDASVEVLSQALEGASEPSHRRHWLERVRQANEKAWTVIDQELYRTGWSEARAVRTLIETLTPGSLLALGNSLPVREVDLVGRARRAECMVWSQRGASGIDGLVAGAAGAASASGRPTTLLIGDVSLLHDVGGLAVARACSTALRIVVLHNEGGRIFEQLPLGDRADLPAGGMRFWTTPSSDGFEHAAAQFGIPFVRVESAAGLTECLGPEPRGVALIEVRVPPDSAQRFAIQVRRGLDALESAPVIP